HASRTRLGGDPIVVPAEDQPDDLVSMPWAARTAHMTPRKVLRDRDSTWRPAAGRQHPAMSAEDLRLPPTQIDISRGDCGVDYVVGIARPYADQDRERQFRETTAGGGDAYGRQEFVANRMSQNGVSDQMAPGFRPAIVCRRRVPTHTVPRLVAQVALTLISVTTLCGCSPASNSGWRESSHVQMAAAPYLAFLRAPNRIQRFSIASHVDKWKAELGGGMQSFFTAHLLAPAHDSRQVVVLVRGVNSDVTLVDWASGRVLQRRHLP